MTTQITIRQDDDNILAEVQNMQKLCRELMKTPHYAKMGEVGIFAIVQKAKSMNMNVLDALNGGCYFVNGKVEMSGQAMLSIIRQHGHSVSMDPKSTNTHVRMFGKRADNSDSWCVEFSIDDAKKAGIYKNVWEKYPKTMLTWRCVSMLSRFLFSDILKGVYVQGEISELATSDMANVNYSTGEMISAQVEEVKKISQEQAVQLREILSDCSPDAQKKFDDFVKSNGCQNISDLPATSFDQLINLALKRKSEYQELIQNANPADLEQMEMDLEISE